MLAARLSQTDIPTDTTLADAREAFAYWRARRWQLAWHRRAARREARTMAARWRARLLRAHLERLGLVTIAAAMEPLLGVLGRSRADHARWLWRTVGRRTPPASRKLWLAMAVTGAAIATLGVVVIHAAWVVLF
jgi:hypothetical protein